MHVVPCGVQFASFDRVAATEPGVETLLRQAVDRLSDRWDHVLIDCPPTLALGSISALVASHRALIPVVTQSLSIEPLARLLKTIQRVRERLNPDISVAGLVGCRLDRRANHGPQILNRLRERFASKVYNGSISESVRVAECAGFSKTIIEYDPEGRGAEEYRALAQEFEEREKAWQDKHCPVATR